MEQEEYKFLPNGLSDWKRLSIRAKMLGYIAEDHEESIILIGHGKSIIFSSTLDGYAAAQAWLDKAERQQAHSH